MDNIKEHVKQEVTKIQDVYRNKKERFDVLYKEINNLIDVYIEELIEQCNIECYVNPLVEIENPYTGFDIRCVNHTLILQFTRLNEVKVTVDGFEYQKTIFQSKKEIENIILRFVKYSLGIEKEYKAKTTMLEAVY